MRPAARDLRCPAGGCRRCGRFHHVASGRPRHVGARSQSGSLASGKACGPSLRKPAGARSERTRRLAAQLAVRARAEHQGAAPGLPRRGALSRAGGGHSPDAWLAARTRSYRQPPAVARGGTIGRYRADAARRRGARAERGGNALVGGIGAVSRAGRERARRAGIRYRTVAPARGSVRTALAIGVGP